MNSEGGRWGTPRRGLTWIEGRPEAELKRDPEWYLSTGRAGRYADPFGVPYDVMADRTLYLEFLGVDANDREAVLAFANRYGLLGVGGSPIVAVDTVSWPESSIYGEPWDEWKSQARTLKVASRLREAIALEERPKLLKLLHRRNYTGKQLGPSGEKGWWIQTPGLTMSLLDGDVRRSNPEVGDLDDVVVAANLVLCRLINAHLYQQTALTLRYSARAGKAELNPIPATLCGALWLQVALATSGDPNYQKCVQCERWFEVTGSAVGGKRKKRLDRIYCSDKCRCRAFRDRKRIAVSRKGARTTRK